MSVWLLDLYPKSRLHGKLGLYSLQLESARLEVKKKLVFPKGKQLVKRSFDLESNEGGYLWHVAQ
jgi:hypothetical protein